MNNLDKFYKIISSTFRVRDIENLKDEYGPDDIEEWDSLNHIELVTELEEVYEISLPVEDVSRMYTIGDIKNILRKHGIEI